MHSTREVFERADDGLEHRGSMAFDLRLYSPAELRERLLDAGFESVALYAELDGESPAHDSIRQVAVARR